MKGYVNSIESFSTLDGPGIRSVVFLQGCPLRCLYCHNPEAWVMANGSVSESSDIIKKVSRNSNYILKSGGVTISGGEPTCQIDFLRELLAGLKSIGFHTAVDTSGYVSIDKIEQILNLTDLFIIDIKHMDPVSCRKLTGKGNARVFELMDYLNLHKKDVWIRHVLVKGITDSEKHIADLCAYIKQYNNIRNFEFLPYHDMAKEKYARLGIDYKLKHLTSYDLKDCENIQQVFRKQYEKLG